MQQILDQIDRAIGAMTEAKGYGSRRTRPAIRAAVNAAERALHPVENQLLVRDAVEAYDTLKGDFEDSLMGFLSDFQEGEITKTAFRSGMRDAIKYNYTEAYRLGIERGGSRHGLETEDLSWLNKAKGEEYDFAKAFVDDIEDGAGHMPYERRMAMYVNSLDGMYNHGTVEAQDDTTAIQWVLGVAEHCGDCIALAAGSPYTKVTLPAVPRDGSTVCRSNCKCHLIYRHGMVEPPPGAERKVAKGVPPEALPEGFRRPNDAERSFIENLMARINFSREMIPHLQGANKRVEILTRQGLGERVIRFMEARKIWVPPTWAAGNRRAGGVIHRASLEEVLKGRDISVDQIRRLRKVSQGDFDGLIDQIEAGLTVRGALIAHTAGDRSNADKAQRTASLVMAAALVGAITAHGEPRAPSAGTAEDLEGVGIPGDDTTTPEEEWQEGEE